MSLIEAVVMKKLLPTIKVSGFSSLSVLLGTLTGLFFSPKDLIFGKSHLSSAGVGDDLKITPFSYMPNIYMSLEMLTILVPSLANILMLAHALGLLLVMLPVGAAVMLGFFLLCYPTNPGP